MQFTLKHKWFLLSSLVILIIGLSTGSFLYLKHKSNAGSQQLIDEKYNLPDKSTIRLVHIGKPQKGLIFYIGDSKYPKETTDFAKKIAALSYYVVVLDEKTALNQAKPQGQCLNFSSYFTGLYDVLDDQLDLDDDELPIIVGTDAGAAIAYISLAQADKQQFHAGVSINFAPHIATSQMLCQIPDTQQHGDDTLLPAVKHLLPAGMFFKTKKNIAQLASSEFADNIGNAKLKIPEGPTQTPISEAIQILQWLDPRLSDQTLSDNSEGDLPIIEVPAVDNVAPTTTMAIIFTGDGGWAEIDKSVAKILSEKGIPTVGIDSLSYFWKRREPEDTARELEHVINQHLKKWNKQDTILIGYSFGADVLPFIANQLADDTRQKISLVALLGVGETAAFEFHLSSWMNADKDTTRRPILPELKNMNWANSLCIYGEADREANCKATESVGVKVISMPGDHHFNKKYDQLVQYLLDNQKSKKTTP